MHLLVRRTFTRIKSWHSMIDVLEDILAASLRPIDRVLGLIIVISAVLGGACMFGCSSSGPFRPSASSVQSSASNSGGIASPFRYSPSTKENTGDKPDPIKPPVRHSCAENLSLGSIFNMWFTRINFISMNAASAGTFPA